MEGGCFMEAKVVWKGRLNFEGRAESGFHLPLDGSLDAGGENHGFRPMELLVIGLAGCSGMDVISILKKKQQEVANFEVIVRADRAEQHPRVFTRVEMEYKVEGKAIDRAAVERAVQLSIEKYCPAYAMLGKAVPIDIKISVSDI